jgi:hypothetical protein
MAQMKFNNTFGAVADGVGIDLQRSDLWKVQLFLPRALNVSWESHVEFLLEKFPFPPREREMIEVKYMQQTNWLIGKDTATTPIEIPVRYAFAVPVAQALERWFSMVGNQVTGGVGLTSACKCMGQMSWYVPNMAQQVATIGIAPSQNIGDNAMDEGLVYALEGCIIKGLKFSDADMTTSGHVNMLFSLQIDRYFPSPESWRKNLVVVPTAAPQ